MANNGASSSSSSSGVSLGTNTVATIVIAAYALISSGSIYLLMTHQMSDNPSANAVINIVLGNLGAMAAGVVHFYMGSAVGSKAKDELLANAREQVSSIAKDAVAASRDATPSTSPKP